MQREMHYHYGRRYLARANYIRAKVALPGSGLKPGHRTRWLKTGTFCPYCGLNPNKLSLRIMEQTMENLIRGG